MQHILTANYQQCCKHKKIAHLRPEEKRGRKGGLDMHDICLVTSSLSYCFFIGYWYRTVIELSDFFHRVKLAWQPTTASKIFLSPLLGVSRVKALYIFEGVRGLHPKVKGTSKIKFSSTWTNNISAWAQYARGERSLHVMWITSYLTRQFFRMNMHHIYSVIICAGKCDKYATICVCPFVRAVSMQ